MEFLFGEELANKEVPKFIAPSDIEIKDWLIETEGKLDKELVEYLNILIQTEYVYTGKLNLAQRAYIYHILIE